MRAGARVYGEEEVVGLQIRVEVRPGDAGLEGYIHVIWAEFDYFIHVCEGDRDYIGDRNTLSSISKQRAPSKRTRTPKENKCKHEEGDEKGSGLNTPQETSLQNKE